MSENVRGLFCELADLPTVQRDSWYARQEVPTVVRSELESLLGFDGPGVESITGIVKGAAEQFLLSDAPVTGERRCGPYRVIRLLGNGGMGAVYLAERADGEVEQQVAIKFVRAGQNLPSFRSRFLRERQILASLNHPGIARLLDAGHSAGHPYLAMEFVQGTRIDEFASTLDVKQILELFVAVCEAVSYAHRNLIVHRDLKPSNILVDSAGRPKLLDFGIAKLLDAPDETRTIEQMMTPEYASPEQRRGEAEATSTDIYSLGAVLYRLLTGRSPRVLAHGTSELPKDLAAILSKTMREEPEERYGSVDLLIADVRAYLEHRPVDACRGNAWYHARVFVRRRWLPIAAAALATFGIFGGLLVANRERAIAERRFQQVRQLSKEFLDLDADIQVLPGSTKARNHIVSASLGYLERLASEARRPRWGLVSVQDLDLKLEIGAAYLKVARVQGVPINSNLGQFRQARESLTKGDELVESVLSARDFPRRREALLTSAEIARDAMILAQIENHSAEALAFGDKAAKRLEALLVSPGISRAEAASAAGIYVNLAQALSNLHHLDEAALYANRSVEISRAVAPGGRHLGKGLGILANTLRFAGDLEGALRAIRESVAIGQRLAQPDNSESMLQLAGALWREGLILGELNNLSLDRPREAEAPLQKALDIAETLAIRDPQDYTSRSYVSMAGRELGDILRDSDPARALAVYDHAIQRVTEVNNSKSRRDEVWLLTGSSYALRRLGRTAEARQRIDIALNILRGLNAYPAAGVELGEESDAAWRALADHYADTGRIGAAIITYKELHEKLLASNPQPKTDLRHANNLSRLYRALEHLHLLAGHVSEARVLHEQRLELWRYWDRKLPDNPFIGRQLEEARLKQAAPAT